MLITRSFLKIIDFCKKVMKLRLARLIIVLTGFCASIIKKVVIICSRTSRFDQRVWYLSRQWNFLGRESQDRGNQKVMVRFG